MKYYIIDNKIIASLTGFNPEFYNYPELTAEQSAFYELHNCSLQEVLNLKLNEYPVQSLTDVKQAKINGFKDRARIELSETDWMTIRHGEQKALNIETSLTIAEYSQLLADRQAIRTKCNSLELQVNQASTIDAVNLINWDNI